MRKKLSYIQILIIAFLCPLSLTAKDLGVHGALFPIDEENLLTLIQSRLYRLETSGKLKILQKEIQDKVSEKVLNPTPVENIQVTQTPRIFLFDPTLSIEENILDAQGDIIVKAGTRINPLDYKNWGKPLLFIKGEIEAHQQLISQYPEAHIVLVSGQPLKLEKELRRPIYFDQAGFLTRKFNIQQVPCLISQDKNHLRIEEFLTTGEKS